MDSLHPNWQTTDAEERPVRINIQERKPVRKSAALPSVPRARRSPAAFIGVALFLACGFVIFKGADGLIGQLSSSDTEISLTDTEATPTVVTVAPGQTIKWMNNATIPHILQSDTLPTENGEPFESTAIFPGGDFIYTVPATAAEGEYDYYSNTSPEVSGQIFIAMESAVTDPAPIAFEETSIEPTEEIMEELPPASTDSYAEITMEEPIRESPVEVPDSIFENLDAPTVLAGSIPSNPHTVAGGGIPAPVSYVPNETLHSGAPLDEHRPNTMSQTGSETMLVVLALSMAGLYLLTRKHFIVQ
jgi:plastocyanin